jgi:membrane-associated protease RseP (regulator of RpoE activity)
MNRNWIVAALAALTLSSVAVAQEPAPRARATPRPRVRTRVETGPFGNFVFAGSRGRIGVVVKTDADATNDKVGARIEAVTPGSPADKAGLKAGDIITRFDGTALGGVAAESDEDSGPGMKLIDLARALDPGDTVQVEYRRGTTNSKASIVAEELGGNMRLYTPELGNMPEMGEMPELSLPKMWGGPGTGPGAFAWTIGDDAWGGIELVSLNPDLGEYFGTREGVLVVRASEDSTLPLKGGDVIVAIGGRKPTSPMHAMRILRSYDEGETVSIDVLRKQKRSTLTWKVPAAEDRFKERFNLTPGRARRPPREEPSRYRVAPKIRMAPVWTKLSVRARATI